MGTREDRWFEVWYSPGSDLRPQYDLLPTWLLIAVPDVEHSGHVLVFDPFNSGEVVFRGASYEEAVSWLCEDEFELAQGRMFPDDGFPLHTSSIQP
jgi:hypothetical protein